MLDSSPSTLRLVYLGVTLFGSVALASPGQPLEGGDAPGRVTQTQSPSGSSVVTVRETVRLEAARRCSAALLADAPGARLTDQLPGSKLPRLYTGLDRLILPGNDQTGREQNLLTRLAPLWGGFSLKEESRSQRGSRLTLRYSATLDGRPVWGHQIVMTFNGDQLITLNTDLGPAPKLKPATKSAHTLVELARRRF
ncbi:MAG: hypothetical protein VYD19_06575, partial [Myxococcota bacterium]|nr:hypothetical protein [Myxococcota bacterium]